MADEWNLADPLIDFVEAESLRSHLQNLLVRLVLGPEVDDPVTADLVEALDLLVLAPPKIVSILLVVFELDEDALADDVKEHVGRSSEVRVDVVGLFVAVDLHVGDQCVSSLDHGGDDLLEVALTDGLTGEAHTGLLSGDMCKSILTET